MEASEKPDLKALIEQDKERRLQEFSPKFEALLKEFNVQLVPQVVITGGKIESKIMIIANG